MTFIIKTFATAAVAIAIATTATCPHTATAQDGKQAAPLRIAVAGVAHGHLNNVISEMNSGDFEIVGVYESDPRMLHDNGLSKRIDKSRLFDNMEKMLDTTHPEAVVAYGSTLSHLRVVEACAPRGIHVMVEKPLATNARDAAAMQRLAQRHGIMVLTNYETSWYEANHTARTMIANGEIGKPTRMIIYDGHQGPKEIGCGTDFTDWLTDPTENGGGAITDFGCYGANIATWLMNGEKPISVTAVTNCQKPDKYPHVDDDATIMLQYDNMTVVIMPSWNWPMNRKDMHIYGTEGFLYQSSPKGLSIYRDGKEKQVETKPLPHHSNNPFRYLKAAVRGDIKIAAHDLASTENNIIVMQILDAARKSARSGKRVEL